MNANDIIDNIRIIDAIICMVPARAVNYTGRLAEIKAELSDVDGDLDEALLIAASMGANACQIAILALESKSDRIRAAWMKDAVKALAIANRAYIRFAN